MIGLCGTWEREAMPAPQSPPRTRQRSVRGHRVERYGVVGLGRMSRWLAARALRAGFQVVACGRAPGSSDLLELGLTSAHGLLDLAATLSAPRIVFLHVPPGREHDGVLDDLALRLDAGDVVVDAGEGHWGGQALRHRRFAARGIELVDLGLLGDADDAGHACFALGGERPGRSRVESLLLHLVPEGRVHAGSPGAGRFARHVHRAEEMEAPRDRESRGVHRVHALRIELDRERGARGAGAPAGAPACARHLAAIRLYETIAQGARGAFPTAIA